MTLFKDEDAMQKWLSAKFSRGLSLSELVNNYEEYEEININQSDSLVLRKIKRSFEYCVASFDNNEVISQGENISLESKDKLRPDLCYMHPATESIIIVELKNLNSATREAGTEIGAYGAELKSYLPFISEGEVVNVIISTVWPTLLRHFIFNEIFWLHRNLICLEPVETADGILLHIVDPALFDVADINKALTSRRLSGYQICLYDDQLYKGGEYYRISAYENRMRAALNAMLVSGNTLKTHGFAFLWRHCWEIGLSPYNITVINFSSFETLERLLSQNKLVSTQFTKTLKKVLKEYAPNGHGQALDSITDAGMPFLKGFCDPRPEGFMSWPELRPNIFYQTDALAFTGWGIFSELYSDLLAREYENDADWPEDSAVLAAKMLDELNYRL